MVRTTISMVIADPVARMETDTPEVDAESVLRTLPAERFPRVIELVLHGIEVTAARRWSATSGNAC
jgi:hypothetical protein